MANLIDFRFRNADNDDPICGLTINYAVQTVVVLANNDKPQDPPQPRGGVYNSEVLLDGTETTDSNGYIQVDVTNMFTDEQFIQIFTKYANLKGYNVSILITLMTEKQQIGPIIYLGKTEIPKELLGYNVVLKGVTYSYNDLDYSDVYQDYYINEVVIDAEGLKKAQSQKNIAQKDYIEKLTSFQGDIQSQGILLIPTLNRYNPINITQVITRCLELNVGCVENALTYSRDAAVVAETNRLNGIQNTIEQISNLYPNISIEQGEGLPYQNVGVIPTPFRGYSFVQNQDGLIFFLGTLMNPYGFNTDSNPSISLNGEVIEFAEWERTFTEPDQSETTVQTAGITARFRFMDIDSIVINYQGKNGLPQVGLVPGDVLSVTSVVDYKGDFNACVEGVDCYQPIGGQFTTSLVIK
jgi:hypothetical protein